MTNWSENLYNDVMMYLPDAPKPLVDRAIVTTAGNFFRDTRVLTDEVHIEQLCNQYDYLIPEKEGQRIVFIDRVSCGKCGLTSADWATVRPAEYKHAYGYWVELNKPRPSIRIPQVTPGNMIGIEYSWTPSGTECELPDYIVGRYSSTLLHGVLGQLYMMRLDETQYDPNMARMHQQEYERERNNAMNEKYQNFQNMSLNMRGRSFI